MFKRLKEPFGKAGLTVAVIALVFAMLGGAYAAGALTGKQKKEVEKIAKKYAGKPGAAGAQGSAGAAGAKGDTGAAGTNGKDGTNGTNGTNGAKGADGTFSTEPLPPGETLTGVFAAAKNKIGPESFTRSLDSISFPINVSPAPTAIYQLNFFGLVFGIELQDGGYEIYGPGGHLEDLEEEEAEEAEAAFSQACPGTRAAPTAEPGFLCLYEGVVAEGPQEIPTAIEAANEFGIVIPFQPAGSDIRGSWAVTG